MQCSVHQIILRIFKRKRLDLVEIGHCQISNAQLMKKYFKSEIYSDKEEKIGYLKAEVCKRVIEDEDGDKSTLEFLLQSFPNFTFTRLNKTIDWNRLYNADLNR